VALLQTVWKAAWGNRTPCDQLCGTDKLSVRIGSLGKHTSGFEFAERFAEVKLASGH
jgi:hypothetical protein